MKSKKQV